MLILIDNYDSFTYNLYQALCTAAGTVRVFRNDALPAADIQRLNPSHLVISPGPGEPSGAGISKELIRKMAGQCPILGVCLGHQCINEVFGGRTIRAPLPVHGKTSVIRHDGQSIYAGLPSEIEVARYHSLVADPDHLPAELVATAWSADGVVMGLRHRSLPIEGVQFHPESFLTPLGSRLLAGFLRMGVYAPAA